jgi:hypothetical protein
MSSSACLNNTVSHVCVCVWYQEDGIKESRGWGGTSGLKNWALDLQHETRVEGSSHPCTKGHHSKKEFLQFEGSHI